jgi:hypothetical protein
MKIQTHERLDEHDLMRIERLIESATAGPWYSYAVGRDTDTASNRIESGWCNELGSFKSMEVAGGTIADLDFIASARQDLPRLLLEVRALRAMLESTHDAQISELTQSHVSGTDASTAALSV